MAAWETCPRALCHRHGRCVYQSQRSPCRSAIQPPTPAPPLSHTNLPLVVSLTGLTIVEDDTMSPTEVRVHPEVFGAVRGAFVRADILHSIHLPTRVVLHPFTSVGDEEIGE